MPQLDQIRVHVRYERLYSSELRALLSTIERAYNQSYCFVNKRRRVSDEDRLRVESAHTERSILTALSGQRLTIFFLAGLFHWLQKERQLYWQTEKVKWEALSAKKSLNDAERRETESQITNAVKTENKNVTRAIKSIQEIEKKSSPNITTIEVSFDLGDASEPGEIKVVSKPKRRITFEDE